MTLRTKTKTLDFSRAFTLGVAGEVFPAGSYEVEADDEVLEGLSVTAYRRVQTLIHVPGKAGSMGIAYTLAVDPGELDAALARDRASSTFRPVLDQAADEPLLLAADTRTLPDDADGHAVDRAEGEGMVRRF